MNFQVTFNSPNSSLVPYSSALLILLILLLPCQSIGQDVITYTKNKWHKTDRGLEIKNMGIYSDYENRFFLKKAQKAPSQKEFWVIFGGEGGEFSLERDDQFNYSKGAFIYAQDEISISSEVGTSPKWKLTSRSDTLFLCIKGDDSNVSKGTKYCLLYKTIQVPSKSGESGPLASTEKTVEIMSFTADNEGVKKVKIDDSSPQNERLTGFKIIATFLSTYTFGQTLK
ncbi:MAG: hypothetical protein MRZ79_01815 [Bacteroidia bacterium]|nr:hypothetical protein [Bacteroidia bacterium]